MHLPGAIYADSNSKNDVFPERFSNQIYFSQGSKIHFGYRSVYSIKYAIEGEELYEVGQRFNRVKTNHYLVVNNEQDVLCLPDDNNTGISIFIAPDLMLDVFKNLCVTDNELLASPFHNSQPPLFCEHLSVLEDEALKQIIAEIIGYFDMNKVKQARCTIDLFYRIAEALILSHRESFYCLKRIAAVKHSTRDELLRRMFKAREFLNDNWHATISIEQLAKAVYMSPFHFHRTFTSTFKITPTQYLKLIRMQRAKELLASEHSITTVAVKVGYEDVFSFSKAFKKMFGFPPSHAKTV